MSEDFAKRLRSAMVEKHMSQSDLAREVWGEYRDTRGYMTAKNRDRVSVYLRGEGLPTDETLAKICTVLNKPREYFYPAPAEIHVTIKNVNLVDIPLTLLATITPYLQGEAK